MYFGPTSASSFPYNFASNLSAFKFLHSVIVFIHLWAQEDEMTLIGVGAVLGALSGLTQVPFY